MSRLDSVVGNSSPVGLADQFEFVQRFARSQRLPPRGLFRVIATDVRGPRRFSHTLFFSSLLAAPFYRELVAAHYTLPAPDKHGPFNAADLSPADFVAIEAPELMRRIDAHLGYRRYGCAPIPLARRRNVTEFIASLLDAHAIAFELVPCRWFSEPDNTVYPHEWSHAVLEFREYGIFDTLHRTFVCLMFAFD